MGGGSANNTADTLITHTKQRLKALHDSYNLVSYWEKKKKISYIIYIATYIQVQLRRHLSWCYFTCCCYCHYCCFYSFVVLSVIIVLLLLPFCCAVIRLICYNTVLSTVAEDSKRREGRERFMTSKFDQRLEEAGLLKLPKHRHTSDDSFLPPSSCLSSSTEDLMADSKDPGYAKLVILSSAGPVCPLPSEKESGEQWQEEDYANPVDALKSNCQVDQAKFIISPSPPSSPPIPDIPSSCPLDAYQSVDEVRMMREKQLKEKEFDGVKLREKDKHSKKGGSRAEASGSHDFSYFQYDDNPGYSKPFDALPEPRNRLPSADSKRSPPTTAGGGGGMLGLRVNSSEKVCKEPSARFLHHVKSGPLPGGHFGGSHSLFRTPNSSPNMSTVGLDHSPMSHGQGSIPDGSPKSGNQSSTTLNPSTHVNRYILKVGDKQAESKDLLSRGETGRTSSVDSALRSHTPAKITKLRNGKDRVAVIPGKFSESKKN